MSNNCPQALTLTIALTVTSACSIQLTTTEPDTTAPDTTTDSPENQPTGTTALTDTELAEIHKFAAYLEADLYNEATVFTFTEHLTLIAVVVDNFGTASWVVNSSELKRCPPL